MSTRTNTDRKLAYHAEVRALEAERRVGRMAARVAELERAIASHRDSDGWSDNDLWAILPRHLKRRPK